MKIEKLEESNSALKTDLKLAREILRGQVGTNESLIKLPHSTRIGQFFRWLGHVPRSWITIIWQKSRNWSFFGVVFFCNFVCGVESFVQVSCPHNKQEINSKTS